MFTSWGPYRSSVWKIYQDLKQNEILSYNLIATGSGFGYLLDVLGVLANKIEKTSEYTIPNINIYYTVRCNAVHDHFRNEVEILLRAIKCRGTANISFNWYVTTETSRKQFNEDKMENLGSHMIITKKGKLYISVLSLMLKLKGKFIIVES